MLGTGVRGYRDECRLLIGAKEAESQPLKACSVLGPGGRAGCHPARVCCGGHWGCKSPEVTEGRECPRKGEQPNLGVVREADESGGSVVQM